MIARCVICDGQQEFEHTVPLRCSSCGAALAMRIIPVNKHTGRGRVEWSRPALPVLARELEEALERARG